jgi:hypothetical protein
MPSLSDASVGRRGGKKRFAQLTPEERRELARKAVQAAAKREGAQTKVLTTDGLPLIFALVQGAQRGVR